MNEFEKRAIKMLSEEEREKIVGGTAETEELSKEQCAQLRSAVDKFSEKQQIQFLKPYPIDKEKIIKPPVVMMYGIREPQHLFEPPKDKDKTHEE